MGYLASRKESLAPRIRYIAPDDPQERVHGLRIGYRAVPERMDHQPVMPQYDSTCIQSQVLLVWEIREVGITRRRSYSGLALYSDDSRSPSLTLGSFKVAGVGGFIV